MKIVIMAGGKGTRIAKVANDIPKPMIRLCEKPILQHQIECLKKQGFVDIILVIGHLGKIIKDYFDDGKKFGVNIKYYEEVMPLGTAGALAYLKEDLKEDFVLINGDIIFDIDLNRCINYHKTKCAKATLITHPNDHPYDSAIIVTDDNMKVIDWLHKEEKREFYKNRVNSGIHILSSEIIENIPLGKKTDLDRDVLKPLINCENIYAYDTPEYIKDMGTPERLIAVSKDYISGKIKSKNLLNKQKAIFLDRDGTINKYIKFLTNINDFELIDGVTEAIKKINSSEYLAIVVTNQPVIARGECSLKQLNNIHNKMETLLGKEGAYLDDIFYCPHHPDKGFKGEIIEYKIECECRKPKPGMLLKATEKYNIDLKSSFMIGDSQRDIEAGKATGCKCFFINSQKSETKYKDVVVCNDLLECINKILLI